MPYRGMHLAELLRHQIAEPETSWAIGTFGAVAEFHRDIDEPVAVSVSGAVTARGGIDLSVHAAVRAVAWERPSSGDAWTHGIALCLTSDASAMSQRTAITEIGPDGAALRGEDSREVLFDLGVGALHCDFYIRTANPLLLRALRAAVGCSVLKSELLGEITAISPTRVSASRLGRVEVRTPIPTADDRTPDGPHTHLLPELLKLRRTHSANIPLPQGLIPCAEMFPASAVHDAHGRQKLFDSAKHERFQTLFTMYGDPSCIRAKRETIAAVRAARPPTDMPSYTRAQRTVRRVALRQLARTDGPSPALAAWRAAFDRGA